jgi:hypothetical protein
MTSLQIEVNPASLLHRHPKPQPVGAQPFLPPLSGADLKQSAKSCLAKPGLKPNRSRTVLKAV